MVIELSEFVRPRDLAFVFLLAVFQFQAPVLRLFLAQPPLLLASAGFMPNKDYKALNIHRNVSVEAMIKGDVDAVAVGSSHVGNIRGKFPDIGLRVAARGPDLPNDVLVAGAHVSAANVAKMRDAFIKNGKKLLDAALVGEDNKKYRGGKFLANVKDSDYEYVRKAYITVGAESLAKFLGN